MKTVQVAPGTNLLRVRTQICVYTAGILNWLSEDDDQNLMKMWRTSTLRRLHAIHYDPALPLSDKSPPISDDDLSDALDRWLPGERFTQGRFPTEELLTNMNNALLINFIGGGELFRFPLEKGKVLYNKGGTFTLCNAHVLQLSLVHGDYYKAMLSLDPDLLFTTTPICTYYDKFLQIGGDEAGEVDGEQVVKEPGSFIQPIINNHFDAMINAIKVKLGGTEALNRAEALIGANATGAKNPDFQEYVKIVLECLNQTYNEGSEFESFELLCRRRMAERVDEMLRVLQSDDARQATVAMQGMLSRSDG